MGIACEQAVGAIRLVTVEDQDLASLLAAFISYRAQGRLIDRGWDVLHVYIAVIAYGGVENRS